MIDIAHMYNSNTQFSRHNMPKLFFRHKIYLLPPWWGSLSVPHFRLVHSYTVTPELITMLLMTPGLKLSMEEARIQFHPVMEKKNFKNHSIVDVSLID